MYVYSKVLNLNFWNKVKKFNVPYIITYIDKITFNILRPLTIIKNLCKKSYA